MRMLKHYWICCSVINIVLMNRVMMMNVDDDIDDE